MTALVTPWQFSPLKPFGYDLVMIDPPYPFGYRSDAGETAKSRQKQFGCMPIPAIKALRVGELVRAPSLALLWIPTCQLPLGLELLDIWGFVFKSEIVWRKLTRKNGVVRMGTGYRVRSMHETMLLGTIGSPRHKPFPSLFDGIAREHSRKPEEAYAICEKAWPDSYKLELFSRTSRPGWDTWGLEAGKFDPVVSQNAPSTESEKSYVPPAAERAA